MKAKLTWFALFLIGVMFVSFATVVIGDVDLRAKHTDITEKARYTGFITEQPLSTGELSFIDIDDMPQGTKYVELKLSNASDKVKVTLFDNATTEQIIEAGISNGRNFIDLQGYYQYVQIRFAPNVSFDLLNLRLSNHLPLRVRHILGFILFLSAWTAFMVFAGRKGNVTFAHIAIFKRYIYLLINLVKMDFATKYRRSVLGVLWSVLNPLLMMIVMYTVFSKLFRVTVPNYPVFYLTGTLIFGLMSEATGNALGSVVGSAGLIKKVYIPKYIFPIEKCMFALVNTIFSFVAVLILTPILGVPLRPTVLLFFIPILYTLVFSMGLGMILAAGNAFFRDIGHLYGVLITMWQFLTPVIYSEDAVPMEVRAVFVFNPMYYYVKYFRDVMMYNRIPDLRQNMICLAWSVSFLIVGLVVFKVKQDKFILYI
ncbi:MAG: ABC transporter permease [Clostridiales bacterium]|jgi:ABC-2 type transport system permease protein|nr:ABC transporter permease [Clostridiales bacterium]